MSLHRAVAVSIGSWTILLAGCDYPSWNGLPFIFTVTPTTLSLQAGGASVAGTGTLSVSIKRQGPFEGAVTVPVEGLPAGVTASALTIGARETAGSITVTAAASATVGTATLTLRPWGTAARSPPTNVQLTITAASPK